jgi:iron complex transport system substrate-binding protein
MRSNTTIKFIRIVIRNSRWVICKILKQTGGFMTAYKKNRLISSLIVLILSTMFLLAPICGWSAGKRTIVDQLGREVIIPAKVDRVVVLMHNALIMMLELGAQDQIVGVLKRWPQYISAGIKDAWPQLDTVATPGDLRTVNVESVLALNPDLVIVTHYAIETVGKQLEAVGVPVVGISLYKAEYEEASVLNPVLKDPDKAYTEGMKEGILLLGNILDRKERAQKLVAHILENRKLVEDRLAGLRKEDRVTTYMAYPKMYSMGHGKYAMVIMERAGGLNVAAELNGYQKVSMEDALKWNPAVIFTQERYRPVADEIRKADAWQAIDAVKSDRVYVTPEYVKPWGHPCPESIGLGELWMAKKLHPDKFKDIDMQAYADRFYRTFYGIPYTGGN